MWVSEEWSCLQVGVTWVKLILSGSAESGFLLAWRMSGWQTEVTFPAIMMDLSAFPCVSASFCLRSLDTLCSLGTC